MRKILYFSFYYLLSALGIIHPVFKVLAINGETERLERKKRFEEARELRSKYLKKIQNKYLAPLWRQEGFDLLYRVKDYHSSLIAFENAMQTLEQSAALYGVASPLDIYFGASMASVSLNNREKATRYFNEFSSLHELFSRNPKLGQALSNYKEGIEWVSNYLNKDTDNK